MDNLGFQECCAKVVAEAALTDEEKKELLNNSLPKRKEKDLTSSDIDVIAKSIVDNM